MSENSKIQWTDDTHNFWRGCVKVSPGCANCYAEVSTPVRVARSEGRELWGGTLRDRAKDFDAPLRWNEKPWACGECGAVTETRFECPKCGAPGDYLHRRRVFSLSLGDWLDDAVPIEWLADMLDVIRRCSNLDFLLLTKRPELFESRIRHARSWLMAHIHRRGFLDAQASGNLNFPDCLTNPNFDRVRAEVSAKSRDECFAIESKYLDTTEMVCAWTRSDFESGDDEPPANVWIGTTVEDQTRADERIPALLKIPARVRFLSVEPMLEAVTLPLKGCRASFRDGDCVWEHCPKTLPCPLHACDTKKDDEGDTYPVQRGIHWVIVGGESGPKARPFDIDWAASVVRQCKEAGVPVFVKQMGAFPLVENANMFDFPDDVELKPFGQGFASARIQLKDNKGGDMAEWPDQLQIREFPVVHPV